MKAFHLILIALLALTVSLVQGQVSKGSIDGVVRDGKSNQPVPGVRVTLDRYVAAALAGGNAGLRGAGPVEGIPVPAVSTDGEGKFAFKDVDPGEYRITVQSNGYVRQDIGQKTFPGVGTPIRIGQGTVVHDLAVRLISTGTVSGQLRNQFGQGAAGVPVRLVLPMYDARGNRSISAVTWTRTNDRGEYRLYYVTPGRYYLSIGNVEGSPQTTGANVMNTTGSPNEGSNVYAEAYFPGVDAIEQAELIEVKPGEENARLNMRADRRDRYHIRGKVIDAATGRPPQSVSFMFNSPPGAPTMSMRSDIDRYDPATGEFDLAMMLPAHYAVIGQVSDPSAGRGAQGRRGSATVRVVDGDVNNVVLTVGAADALKLNGRVRIEGGGALPAPGFQAMRVELRPFIDGAPVKNQIMSSMSNVINPDGSFTVDASLRDPQQVAVAGLIPEGYYVQEAKLGAADVWSKPLVIEGTTPPALEIVLAAKGGQIEGTLSDAQGRPVDSGEVVLVPASGRDRTELFRSAVVGADRRFRFANVPPGDYRLFSWEAILPYAYFDPNLLKRDEANAKQVRVKESTRETVEVRVIPTTLQ